MVRDRPWFFLVGGVNGAGKSTLAQSPDTLQFLVGEAGPAIEIINPDRVTVDIREKKPSMPLAEANVQAARACEKRVDQLINDATRSFAIETVLSTDKYKERVRRAQSRGINVLFVYLLLGSVEEAVARVGRRVSKGGHDVPEQKIRDRWPRSLHNLVWFWEQADAAFVYFNGELPPNETRPASPLAQRNKELISFHLTPPESVRKIMRRLLPKWR